MFLFTESRKAVEHASTVDTAQEAARFLRQHPERLDDFRLWVDYVGAHNHVDHEVGSCLKSLPTLDARRRHYRPASKHLYNSQNIYNSNKTSKIFIRAGCQKDHRPIKLAT